MTETTQRNIRRGFYAILLAITLGGILSWLLSCPVAVDDFFYSTVIPDDALKAGEWIPFSEKIETYSQAWTSVYNHRHLNGRLSNFAHILFQPLPRAVEAVVLSLCLFALVALLFLWTKRCGRLTPFSAAVALILVWTGLPWDNGFQSLDFQANYVPPSMLTVAVLLLLRPGRRLSKKGATGIAVMAFLAGWMHEAFGLSLATYALVLWLLNGRKMPGAVVTMLAVSAGGLLNGICGTFGRMGGAESIAISFNLILHIITQAWTIELALLVSIIAYLLTPKAMRRAYLNDMLPLWAGILCTTAICFAIGWFGRTLWAAELYAIVAILYTVSRFPVKTRPAVASVLMAAFAALYGWWWVQVVKWENIVAGEAKYILEHYPSRPGGPTVVFMPYVDKLDIPFYMFGLVETHLDDMQQSHRIAGWLSLRESGLLVLPEEFKDKPLEEWPFVGSQKFLRGKWPMMVARDSVNLDFRLKVGPANANIPPLNRLMIILKGLDAGGVDSIGGYMGCYKIFMPDGSTAYRYVTEPLPRTVDLRPMVDFDIMPSTHIHE